MKLKIMAAMLMLAGQQLWAADDAESEKDKATTLQEIRVEGRSMRLGAYIVKADDIGRRPLRNGTISDLLLNHGAAQFSGAGRQATRAGEIAPEPVSFHGEPYYNNALVLDGLSNNDIMNPGYSNGGFRTPEKDFDTAPTTLYIAPGAPEMFQVDTSLLKKLTVYDANAPAKYSRFTGGVIDAELKDPDIKKAGGSVSWRTTRSSWTHFHLSGDQSEEEFESADAGNDMQPKFVKHSYSLSLNQPLGGRGAVLLAYSRKESKIPKYHRYLKRWQNGRRSAETWMVKGLYRPHEKHALTATLMYSPHESVFYRNNTKDGRYVSSGGGWRFKLGSKLETSWADIESVLAYTRSRNRIGYDFGADSYQWLGSAYVPGSSLDWCSQTDRRGCARAYQGGFGTLQSANSTWTLKQDYRLRNLNWGASRHRISFGWNIDIARVRSERPQASRYMYAYFNTARNGYPANITNVSPNCRDCIPGEQYQTHMSYFPAFSSKARADSYTLYLSDSIDWKRLTLDAGLNIGYDSVLKNLNIAPRLAFDYDALGNKRLYLFGGLNRYYGGNILAYELRAGIPKNEAYQRINDPKNGESGWTFDKYMNNSQSWKPGSLDTPYSDEANLGLRRRFAGQMLTFHWTHRKSRDQFTPERHADGSHTVVNGGSGNSNLYSFDIHNENPLRLGMLRIGYRAGARYHRYRTDYNGNYEEAQVADLTNNRTPYYLLEGKRYGSIAEMPPFNFNTPWTAFLELKTDIPKWHFKWTHIFSYRPGFKNYQRYSVSQCRLSSQPQACGDWDGAVYDYRLNAYRQALMLDWKLQWDIPIKRSRLELSLDVLNVFDKKVSSANSGSNFVAGTARQSPSGYETGRQFWLGAAYRW